MLKTRLLQAACTVVMLAAAPAFAQTATPPAGTANSTATGQNAGAPKTMSDSKSTMTPANKDGLGASAKSDTHSTHRSAMAHPAHMMRSGKTDSSQDAAVEDLNNKSYQAAQNGAAMAAGGTGNGSTGMMKSGGGSGSMNDMSGGSMTGNGSSGTTKP